MPSVCLLWPPTRKRLRVRGVALRSETEVGERALALPVEEELRHRAVADVEHVGSFRVDLPDVHAARLAAPAVVDEHEDTLAVHLAVLVDHVAQVLPSAQKPLRALCYPGQPVPAPRFRSVRDHRSISGCAHSAEL